MKRLMLAVVVSAFAIGTSIGPAAAQGTPGTCESKAVSKDGKPLAGAAKNSSWRSASARRARPRRSARTASRSRVPRRTVSWRNACASKPHYTARVMLHQAFAAIAAATILVTALAVAS